MESTAESTETEFNKLVEYFRHPAEQLKFSQSDLLALYGYYKQATAGDCRGSRPGLLKVKERAKYDAWKKCSGMSKTEAMTKYVELAKSLVPSLKMHTKL